MNSLTKAKPADSKQARALQILGTKCANCHSTETDWPLYAKLPVAKQVIEKDVQTGLRYVDYHEELAAIADQPASEVVLAKTERALAEGNMPPMKYLALHWDGALSPQEREALMTWIHDIRAQHYASSVVAPEFEKEPVQPLPDKLELDPRKVALGNKLFHDKRLSKDNTVSCASCHGLDKGGTDQAQFSTGVNAAKGDINSPTVFNAAFQFKMFWDGRAGTLEEQADGPVNNPIEMASDWQEAIPKLQEDRELTEAFVAVYPQGYSKETVTEAIAMFERSLITPARFDKYLRGQTDALTVDERHGYEVFKDRGCATCHVGTLLGGKSFELIGRKENYFKTANPPKRDLGRFNVTKKESDRHKFKVPTLRNIAVTYPYLHDGSTSDLKKVVEIMGEYQFEDGLSAADVDAIVKFLHTLTGEYDGKPLGT